MTLQLIPNGHCHRVADLATLLCRSLGVASRETIDVRAAALLHDVGKLALPRRVLCKPGRLSAAECALVATHPVVGAGVGRGLGYGDAVCRGVLHHHERYDGTGYPARLAGGQIPFAARVIAVADAYDVLVSARPYAPALAPDAALGEVARCAGTQFDPDVAAALVRAGVDALARTRGDGGPTVPVGDDARGNCWPTAVATRPLGRSRELRFNSDIRIEIGCGSPAGDG